jgi:hypothetical protein
MYEKDCLIFNPVPYVQCLALADSAFDSIEILEAL